MDADCESGYGLEAAGIRGRWHAAAETYWQKVERIGFPDPEFFGGAVEAGLYLTDDTRSYRSGMFRGIKVKNPVGSGGIGAWQVNLRSEEHTSELQSLMRISYAVFCLKKTTKINT